MDEYIAEIREQSPTLQKKTFLNHASRGPLHGRTAFALRRYADYWSDFDFNIAVERGEQTREQFGKLINASKDEITYIPDVTHGTNIAINLLEYDKESNIVCYYNDYVSQVYNALYMRKYRGIEYRPVKDKKGIVKPEFFAEKIDHNTKIVLLSHVQWLTGFKADIKEIAKIAHENGAYILVDTIQSTGALINDAKDWDVDFLTCGIAKWLLGPAQAGHFYMKKEYIKEFDPPFCGYFGTDHGDNPDIPIWDVSKLEYRDDITKFTDVRPDEVLYDTAYAAMTILLDYGIKKIQDRVFMLTDYLIEQIETKLSSTSFITPIEKKYRSGIVNVRVPNAPSVTKKLLEKNIVISCRNGGLRISPHFYNTIEDIDKLIHAVKHFL